MKCPCHNHGPLKCALCSKDASAKMRPDRVCENLDKRKSIKGRAFHSSVSRTQETRKTFPPSSNNP